MVENREACATSITNLQITHYLSNLRKKKILLLYSSIL